MIRAASVLLAFVTHLVQDDPPTPGGLEAPLDEMVCKADLVVYARPAAGRGGDRTGRESTVRRSSGRRKEVVSLRVEETLVGEPGVDSVVVVMPAGRGEPSAQAGLYFLRRSRSRTEQTDRRKIGGSVGPAWTFELLGGDHGLWQEKGPTVRIAPAGQGMEPRVLAKDRAIALVRESIGRCLPRVEGTLVTTGPTPWRVLVDAQGNVRTGPERVARLTAEEFDHLMEAVDNPAFLAIHRDIGHSPNPCLTYFQIELRTKRGRHTVNCYSPRSVPAEQQGDLSAFLRAWSALPGEDRPDW